MTSIEEQLDDLQQAITVLESQRAMLGDAVIEPALVGLRQQIAALQAQLQEASHATEVRRIVTILFADIVGSTSLAEKLDPEDWREVISQLYTEIGSVIQANSGRIVQYLGDGVLALFGAEIASERDPEFAIRAALEAQNAVASLDLGLPIQIRIGIHTGLVILGEIGSQAKREYTATGDAMNLAARLQASAPAGGILISHDTYRYVRGVFDITPQPLMSVKGKSDLVQSYLVQRLKPRAFRTVTRGVSEITTPTVGREKELESLKAAYQQAFNRRQLVWAQIVGEPGLGKSRLLIEMGDYLELRQERIRLLRGRAFDGETKQPFALIRRMWFDRFQIAEDAPLAEAEGRWVKQFLELSGPGREEEAHAVGLLMGLPFSESVYIGAMRNDPNQVKGRAFVASRALVKVIRQAMPLVVLLDDLHWLDESSWEYLSKVFLEDPEPADENHGVFILATTRQEWSPPSALRNHPGYIQIDLGTLAQDALSQLVRTMLGRVENVTEELIGLIVNRAEGVPYYAEEVVNWFIDRGVIDTHRDPWRFHPGRLDESPLPATLQHLLLTRLSSLREDERAALQRGSVFGRNFWTGGLEALGIPSSEKLLKQLQPRGFVDFQPEAVFEGENEWGFHHNLLHDVTYESVLKRERVMLHKAAAAWLEGQARRAGRINEFTGLLGMHAERAGETEAAASWYLQAGEEAKARGALKEALAFFDQSLSLLPAKDRDRRWRALYEHSKVLGMLGDSEALRADAITLLELARESDDETKLAEANMRWGIYLSGTGEEQKAVPVLETALAAARRGNNRELEAKSLALLTISLMRVGALDKALAAAEQALLCAQAYRDEQTLSNVLINIAVCYTEAGDLARAVHLISQAVEIDRRLRDRYGVLVGLSNLGYSYILLGMPELSQSPLEHAVQIAESIGARRTKTYSLLNLGLAYSRRGEPASAQKLLEETLPESIAVGDTFAQAACLTYLALALELSGKPGEAAERYAKANEMFNQLGVRAYANDALAGLARCALARQQLEPARQLALQLWEALCQVGAKGMEFPIWAYLTCALIFQQSGEMEACRAAAETGYSELIQRADKISAADWRNSYLENIPEHRSIIALQRQFSS